MPPRALPAEQVAGPLVGVDGCRAGWVVAVGGATAGTGPTRLLVVPDVRAVLAIRPSVVGIDIPLGLPASGPRACDLAARARLGPRRSSVFPAPVRAVLGAGDHREAARLSTAASGRSLSIQAWNLVPKIGDADRSVAPGDPVFEVHPELSFATLAGAPLRTRKRDAAGREERLALLTRPFPDVAERLAARPTGCAADDVLDAYAVLWTVRRIAAGTAEVLGDGAVDGTGRTMSITV